MWRIFVWPHPRFKHFWTVMGDKSIALAHLWCKIMLFFKFSVFRGREASRFGGKFRRRRCPMKAIGEWEINRWKNNVYMLQVLVYEIYPLFRLSYFQKSYRKSPLTRMRTLAGFPGASENRPMTGQPHLTGPWLLVGLSQQIIYMVRKIK